MYHYLSKFVAQKVACSNSSGLGSRSESAKVTLTHRQYSRFKSSLRKIHLGFESAILYPEYGNKLHLPPLPYFLD